MTGRSGTPCPKKEPSLGHTKWMVAKISAAETPVLETGRIVKKTSLFSKSKMNNTVSGTAKNCCFFFPVKSRMSSTIVYC